LLAILKELREIKEIMMEVSDMLLDAQVGPRLVALRFRKPAALGAFRPLSFATRTAATPKRSARQLLLCTPSRDARHRADRNRRHADAL